MKYRLINELKLSPVTLGTMRFFDKGLSKNELTALLKYLYYEVGVNTHHCSYEYSSYNLYCEALADLRKDKSVQLHHICKISSPDFKETKFSKAVLREKVQAELKKLGTERISVLQWLYRTEPIDDSLRIPSMHDLLSEIEETFNELVQEGIIGTVGVFPYTIEFGKEVAKHIPSNAGWISYFNFTEKEYIDNLPANQWMIGIRPLAAGNIIKADEVNDLYSNQLTENKDLSDTDKKLMRALAYCFSDVRVKSNIMSINSMTHAKQLKKILSLLG